MSAVFEEIKSTDVVIDSIVDTNYASGYSGKAGMYPQPASARSSGQ